MQMWGYVDGTVSASLPSSMTVEEAMAGQVLPGPIAAAHNGALYVKSLVPGGSAAQSGHVQVGQCLPPSTYTAPTLGPCVTV